MICCWRAELSPLDFHRAVLSAKARRTAPRCRQLRTAVARSVADHQPMPSRARGNERVPFGRSKIVLIGVVYEGRKAMMNLPRPIAASRTP
jgi:hypothetical protein